MRDEMASKVEFLESLDAKLWLWKWMHKKLESYDLGGRQRCIEEPKLFQSKTFQNTKRVPMKSNATNERSKDSSYPYDPGV